MPVKYTIVIGLQNSLHWIKIKVIKKDRFYLTQFNALCILYVQLKWWTRETLVLKLHGEQMLYFPIYFDFWESKIDGLNNLVIVFLKLHLIFFHHCLMNKWSKSGSLIKIWREGRWIKIKYNDWFPIAMSVPWPPPS